MKQILILNSSPKMDGNTASLVNWFCEGAQPQGAQIKIVRTSALKYKTVGCLSCRKCQKIDEYVCSVKDEASPVLALMAHVDVIVMATPLYFFGPSAQLKVLTDRMFSLYKWNNEAGTMKTPLKGKMMVLLASAFENLGLDLLRGPFELTAQYTGMKFESVIVPNAGVSGDIHKIEPFVRQKLVELGAKVAR